MAELKDQSGTTVFKGTGTGFGGTPLSEQFTGLGPNPVADGATGNAGIQHGAGDALLDYSDPAAPTVVAGGVYAVTLRAACHDGTQPGGNWNAGVLLNGSVMSILASSDGPLSGGAVGVASPTLTVTASGPLSAGDSLLFIMSNYRGAPGNLDLSVDIGIVVKIG